VEARSDRGLVFELSGEGVEITLEVDQEGGRARRLSFRSDQDQRDFSGDEIGVEQSAEGTRATVLLESGATDLPGVRFTVIVPTVALGGETSFAVSAAGVRTTSRSLFGGRRLGPRQSYEAVTLAGSVSVVDPVTPGNGTQGECRDWRATHDLRPPGAKLVVTATCTFPTPGYTVELRRREPQGINPADLLLDKVVTEPAGVAADVLNDIQVRYEEDTDFEYKTVTILPGPTIDVERAA
jgi:hypothetical protein